MVKPCALSVSGSDLLCNTRIKSYPDGSREVLVCDRPIFKPAGWEPAKPQSVKNTKKSHPSDSVDRAIRRARAQVRDIALCTPFRWFVTLTLDGARVDRYDIKAVTRRLNAWLDNQVRRHGLAYILVPELHKDGAIHFHGFFNDALEAVDSGTISVNGSKSPRKPRSAAQRASMISQGGHVVYNLPAWSMGFTTAIELYGEYGRAVSYVCKYIGKDQTSAQGEQPGGKIGGRWYYSGGDLGRPQVDYTDSAVRDVENATGAYSFAVKDAGLSFVMLHIEGGCHFGKTAESSALPAPGLEVPDCGLLRQNRADGLRRLSALGGGEWGSPVSI